MPRKRSRAAPQLPVVYRSMGKGSRAIYSPGSRREAWTGNRHEPRHSFSKKAQVELAHSWPYYCFTHSTLLEHPEAAFTAKRCSAAQAKGTPTCKCKCAYRRLIRSTVVNRLPLIAARLRFSMYVLQSAMYAKYTLQRVGLAQTTAATV